MARTHTVLLTLLPTVLILIVLAGVESAAVKAGKDTEAQTGASKRVFMPASDASNFFKRRGRRSPRTYEEYYAEQRVKMATNERLEEQNNEQENYLEEERDEQYERTREKNQQWREFHGQYPRYPHHRYYV
uniref:Unique cartilage matrix-associated protein n=1 Tax=Cyprinus carpio TaxID=7962 RepID=A0A8C2AUC9_CYPCA